LMATDGAVGPWRASGRTARRQRPPARVKPAKPRLGQSQRRHRAPAPARAAADRRASRGRSRPLRTRSAAIHLRHWRRTSELRLTSAVRVCAPCRSGKNWWAFRCDCPSHPERDTKAKDFSCRNTSANQTLKIRTVLPKSGALENTGWRETNFGSGPVHSVNSFGG